MPKVTIDGKQYDVTYNAQDVLDLDNARNAVGQISNTDYILIRKGLGSNSGDCAAIVPALYFAQSIAVSANAEAAALVETWTKAEETREANEETRKKQEEARQTEYEEAEAARDKLYAAAESSRDSKYATAESKRDALYAKEEESRNTAESERVKAETARQEAETNRANAETARVKAETSREAQEKTRVSNENSRGAAESQRQNAESQRQNAEKARESDSLEAVTLANEAANKVTALLAQLETQSNVAPTAMTLEYPTEITTANKVRQRIKATLTPSGVMQNVIFIREDGTSLKADFQGFLTVKGSGTTVFHVVPTMNTLLGKEISITVRAPRMRLTSTGKIRLTSTGKIRI